MKKLLVIFSLAYLLTGCSPTECEECVCPEPENKVDVFKRNQECYKYKKDMQIKNDIDPENEELGTGRITSIFYSPKLDTCLYLYVSLSDELFSFQSLNDVFTGETIEDFFGNINDDNVMAEAEAFRSRVKEYQ